MKASPECLICMLRQALNTGRAVTRNRRHHTDIMARAAKLLPRARLDQTPAMLSQPVYRIVSEVTGEKDPYAAHKRATNREALAMLPGLRRQMLRSKDPLHCALHAAVAGNIIDLGIGHRFDIGPDVRRILRQPFALDDTPAFRREMKPGRRVLYLGDNAGEIVFDRLLVEHLLMSGLSVTFMVKSGPIINDATMEDAAAAGMTGIVRVIETGGADIGINWRNISAEFRRAFRSADVIIAKGHGNFETCEDRPGNFFFLLKAKCEVVAAKLGVRTGDIVFKRRRSR